MSELITLEDMAALEEVLKNAEQGGTVLIFKHSAT